jgi:type I restriction enzyme, S subunit
MNRWTQTTLGKVIELQRGYDLPERDRRPGSIPVVGSAGPNGWHDTAKAAGPGITVGRSGASVGVVTYVPQAYWPHNTVLYVKGFKGNDPRFVSYLLATMPLAEMNSGAAQPSLNRNFLYPLPVRIPPPSIQRRIASILGIYDDLIEVNQRRIALLEEMARRLFEEWFFRFRFPGHEDRPIRHRLRQTS